MLVVANFTPVLAKIPRGRARAGLVPRTLQQRRGILWRDELRERRRSDGRAGAVDGYELLIAAAPAAAGDAVFQAAVKRLWASEFAAAARRWSQFDLAVSFGPWRLSGGRSEY